MKLKTNSGLASLAGLAIGASILFATADAAESGGQDVSAIGNPSFSAAGVETSHGNPALDRFSQSVVFYLSFDDHAMADLSVGNGKPVGNTKGIQWTPGVWGRALRGRTKSLGYAARDNIDLSRAGSLTLWIRPMGWASTDRPKQIPLLNLHDHGNTLYLARQGGAANSQPLIAIFGSKLNDRDTRAFVKNRTSMDWKDQWHLLAINWNADPRYIELSIDGGLFERGTAEQPASSGTKHLNQKEVMRVAAGATASTYYEMDELLILDRLLANEEVKWIYQSAEKGPLADDAKPTQGSTGHLRK